MSRDRQGVAGDDALFDAEVEGGRPLADRGRVRPPVVAGRGVTGPLPQGTTIARSATDLTTGHAADVGERELAQLAAGRPPPEATLDLHGATEASAATELERFLRAARGAGRRCVLIVTGKGLHSTGGAVLRHAVPDLLAGPLAPHVRAFVPARREHGGDGALYVLVARGRP